MTTSTPPLTFPPEVMADLEAVAAAVATGSKPDPELTRRIREHADKARAELLATRGVQDVGVQIIREIRGPLPE